MSQCSGLKLAGIHPENPDIGFCQTMPVHNPVFCSVATQTLKASPFVRFFVSLDSKAIKIALIYLIP